MDVDSKVDLGEQNFDIPEQLKDPDGFLYEALNIYSVLRSLSLVLHLSPFEAETFLGAIQPCVTSNPLMDEIHFSLIRTCAADATKYMTAWYVVDWVLLDRVTWPTYVLPLLQTWLEKADGLERDKIDHAIPQVGGSVFTALLIKQEASVMQTLNAEEAEMVACHNLLVEYFATSSNYHLLPAHKKLQVLQCLTTLLLSSQLMADGFHARSQLDIPMKGDTVIDDPLPLYRKGEDGYPDICIICANDNGEDLLCCDLCPGAFHQTCLKADARDFEGIWECPECAIPDPLRCRGRQQIYKNERGQFLVVGRYVMQKQPTGKFKLLGRRDIEGILRGRKKEDLFKWPWNDFVMSVSRYHPQARSHIGNLQDALFSIERPVPEAFLGYARRFSQVADVDRDYMDEEDAPLRSPAPLPAMHTFRLVSPNEIGMTQCLNIDMLPDCLSPGRYVNRYMNAARCPYLLTLGDSLAPFRCEDLNDLVDKGKKWPAYGASDPVLRSVIYAIETMYLTLGPLAGPTWEDPLNKESFLIRLCNATTLYDAKSLLLELGSNAHISLFQPEWFLSHIELKYLTMGSLGKLDPYVGKDHRTSSRKPPFRVHKFTRVDALLSRVLKVQSFDRSKILKQRKSGKYNQYAPSVAAAVEEEEDNYEDEPDDEQIDEEEEGGFKKNDGVQKKRVEIRFEPTGPVLRRFSSDTQASKRLKVQPVRRITNCARGNEGKSQEEWTQAFGFYWFYVKEDGEKDPVDTDISSLVKMSKSRTITPAPKDVKSDPADNKWKGAPIAKKLDAREKPDGPIIKRFPSGIEAARLLKLKQSQISACARKNEEKSSSNWDYYAGLVWTFAPKIPSPSDGEIQDADVDVLRQIVVDSVSKGKGGAYKGTRGFPGRPSNASLSQSKLYSTSHVANEMKSHAEHGEAMELEALGDDEYAEDETDTNMVVGFRKSSSTVSLGGSAAISVFSESGVRSAKPPPSAKYGRNFYTGRKLVNPSLQPTISSRMTKKLGRAGGRAMLPHVAYPLNAHVDDLPPPPAPLAWYWCQRVQTCTSAEELALQLRYLEQAMRLDDIDKKSPSASCVMKINEEGRCSSVQQPFDSGGDVAAIVNSKYAEKPDKKGMASAYGIWQDIVSSALRAVSGPTPPASTYYVLTEIVTRVEEEEEEEDEEWEKIEDTTTKHHMEDSKLVVKVLGPVEVNLRDLIDFYYRAWLDRWIAKVPRGKNNANSTPMMHLASFGAKITGILSQGAAIDGEGFMTIFADMVASITKERASVLSDLSKLLGFAISDDSVESIYESSLERALTKPSFDEEEKDTKQEKEAPKARGRPKRDPQAMPPIGVTGEKRGRGRPKQKEVSVFSNDLSKGKGKLDPSINPGLYRKPSKRPALESDEKEETAEVKAIKENHAALGKTARKPQNKMEHIISRIMLDLVDRTQEAAISKVRADLLQTFAYEAQENQGDAIDANEIRVADCVTISVATPSGELSQTRDKSLTPAAQLVDFFLRRVYSESRVCLSAPHENKMLSQRLLDRTEAAMIDRSMCSVVQAVEDHYLPQVGDELLYFTNGHKEYDEQYPEPHRKGLFKRENMWVACRVLTVDYEFPKSTTFAGVKGVVVLLQLGVLGVGGSEDSQLPVKQFAVVYTPHHTCGEFLVTLNKMKCTMNRDWKAGQAFSQLFLDGRKTSRYRGVIQTIDRDQEGFPKWNGVRVKWDSEKSVSPQAICEWELEPERGPGKEDGTSDKETRRNVNQKLLKIVTELIKIEEYDAFVKAITGELIFTYINVRVYRSLTVLLTSTRRSRCSRLLAINPCGYVS